MHSTLACTDRKETRHVDHGMLFRHICSCMPLLQALYGKLGYLIVVKHNMNAPKARDTTIFGGSAM